MNKPTRHVFIAMLAAAALTQCHREAPNPRGAESAEGALPPPPAAPPEAAPPETVAESEKPAR